MDAATVTLSACQPPFQLRPAIQRLQPKLVEWRRRFHQFPELGFQEEETAEFIAQQLQEWGINHQTAIAKTGIVALLSGNAPGPVLAIRVDIDALPIQEANPVDYRSRYPGKMHACGHDGHTAIGLGVAHYLHQHPEFSGTVKLIFQPAEEGPGGAQPMIEAKVLENPAVDAIIGLHLWNNLPLGQVGVRSGPLMAAVEIFDCVIEGKGGHGAIPHQTVDAIVIGSQVVSALQTIVARNVDPLDAVVVTVGSFQAGDTHNVIANQARLQGTVRYFKPDYRGSIEQRIEQIVAGVCTAHGARYHLEYRTLYPPVINHPQMSSLVAKVAESVIETPVGIVPDCQTMGGEDFSFFLEQVPGCYFFVGSANSDRQLNYPHHHPRFDFDEAALSIGVELFIRCVEQFCR